MQKILKEAEVLIEIGKVHRVLWADLIRVMEGGLGCPTVSLPKTTAVVVSER